MSLLQTRLRWQEITRSGRPATLRIALLATFTVHPLAPYLGSALEDAGLPADIWSGPYNQIIAQCLSDQSETARFQPHVLVCWPRLEELWGGLPLPLDDSAERYTAPALEVASLALEAARRWRATLLFVLPTLPESQPLGTGDAGNRHGVASTATAAREALRDRLAGQAGVLLLDAEQGLRELGIAQVYNAQLFTVARIPFSEAYFARIGRDMARLVQLSRQAARKVVVVDGDNTLWGGVVGEEGPHGVDLQDNGPGEAFRMFQDYLLELRRSGVLLALSSKNDEADVWAVFARQDMRLNKEDLAAWRINWQAKSSNLQEIAAELGLGIDSFVFIDDNPAEIAEVQAALPHVACLRMPADPAGWRAAIEGAGVLDRLPPSAEDLQRAQQVNVERQRQEVAGRATSPEAYLHDLAVRVRLLAPAPEHLARLAQLINKTNQFNLNGRRRSDAEVLQVSQDPDYLVRLAWAADRFGDYGIVGAAIVHLASATAQLDTFVMSCRALGRGVEQALLAGMFELLPSRGHAHLQATLLALPRNEPARRFFTDLGCTAGETADLIVPAWPTYVTRLPDG